MRTLATGSRAGSASAVGVQVIRRAVAVLLLIIAVMCGLMAIAANTVGSTILRRSTYQQALTQTDAYNRLYTQVLPDPAARDWSEPLLADLPVDRSIITANLRLVFPTATLRNLVDQAITDALSYLRGRTDVLEVRVDLQPVLGNVSRLADRYLGQQLTALPLTGQGSLSALVQQLLTAVEAISAGRSPQAIPLLQLNAEQAKQVAAAVLQRLPATAGTLQPQLEILLAQGDVEGVLALLIPAAYPGSARAVAQLASHLEDGHLLDVGSYFGPLQDQGGMSHLRVMHDVGGHLTLLTCVGAALSLAALAAATRLTGGSRRLLWFGGGLFAIASSALVAGWLGSALVQDPLRRLSGARSPLAPQGRRLVGDIAWELEAQLLDRYLLLAGAVAMAGLTLVAGALVRTRARRTGRRLRLAVGVTAPAMVAAAALLTGPVSVAPSELACNGYVQLCDRPYDQVVYAASHNSMANSEAGFLGPSQDPSIVHQLDDGVRTLLIDTHYWTPADAVQRFLASLPAETQAVLRPLATSVTTSRPGTWLCHDICQLGATPLTRELQEIRRWLDANPHEVVTLIVEDAISVADTERAVRDSGLEPKVAVPPPDPRAPWPTLRQLIDDDKQLYVFAERSDDPSGWYRNFFRYASDTPYRNQSPRALACQPNRGQTSSPLLLVNNWVTRRASSRRDAAQANTAGFLLEQARLCRQVRGRNPTYLAVDYATTGDLMAAVNTLNGVPVG